MISDAILITGAGQRIGEYLAQQFLAQHQSVVFTYRTERPAVDALKAQGALGFQVDFTQPEQLTQFLQDLPQQVSSLRAVVHNASLWLPDSKIKTADMLSDLMTVHISAPYQINQACEPLLRKSQTAVTDIIALSDAKVSKGHADYAGYLASKAGLESLTLSFAKAFAPNIKVNTIAPGLVIFNEGDSEAYKKARLAESAIPVEPGMDSIWQAVQFLMNSPSATGSTVSLGQLQHETF